MDADALLEHLERCNVKLTRRGERLVCDAPRGALTPELRADIRRLKPALLATLAGRAAAEAEPVLSPSQERIAALSELLPGYNAAGNIPLGLRLVGPVDEDALQRALRAIVARHEVFRCALAKAARVRPHYIDSPSLDLETHDLRAADARTRDDHIAKLVAAPFDLHTAPLLRAALLRTSDDEHTLVIITHVMVFDGRSTPLFFKELAAHYSAAITRLPAGGPEPGRYSEFARAQRSALTGAAAERQRAGWIESLAGAELVTGLREHHALDDARSSPPCDLRCAKLEVELPGFLADSVRACARGLGASLFHTLLAAYQALFQRYTLQPSVAIGTIISSRRSVETERMIGSFANNILIRSDFAAETRFADLVHRVRAFLQGSLARQELPFERILDGLPAPLRRLPLFRVMFMFHQLGLEGFDLPGLTAEPVHIPKPVSNHALSLVLSDNRGRLAGTLEYNTSLVTRETAAMLRDRYLLVLRRVCEDPGAPLASLPRFHDRAATSWAAPPKPQRRAGSRCAEPSSPEQIVVDLWTQHLDVDDAVADDDFFAVGGHSLLALSLLSSIERRLELSGLLEPFKERPTLATLIDAATARRSPAEARPYPSAR